MEIKGVLKKILPTVERSNFSSRKVWITTDPQGQYPQTIELEASQAKINMFNNIPFGTWVTCHINIKGREWTNKEGEVIVFNTLSVWKVEVDGKAVDPGAYVLQHEETKEVAAVLESKLKRAKKTVPADDINQSDDLPF